MRRTSLDLVTLVRKVIGGESPSVHSCPLADHADVEALLEPHMPAYYYIVALDSPKDLQMVRPKPEKASAAIPDRPPDFPVVPAVPFAEEARKEILPNLFAEWSYALQLPILIRTNDDGSVEAWLHKDAFDDAED